MISSPPPLCLSLSLSVCLTFLYILLPVLLIDYCSVDPIASKGTGYLSIATSYGLDCRRIEVRFLAGEMNVSLLHSIRTTSRTHVTSFSLAPRIPSWGVQLVEE
jgi:hypothetical protein